MKKPWSISTTVRNPERLRNFLRVLCQLEGQNFDKNNQIKYQILLIKERLYIPLNIPLKFKVYYDNRDKDMPDSIAEEIFYKQNYEDPPMRGRQSANPLNKLGFSIAREGVGTIVITDLGKKFLKEDYDISYIFFKSLLKLQYPNPWSEDFTERDGFDIVPFIALLRVIDKINKIFPERGLNKHEFCIFIPTFINIKDIDECVDRILKYRKTKTKEIKEKFIKAYLKEFYNSKDLSEQKINNLYDYGDNIMRYFRLTKYYRVSTDPLGYHWSIDIEPTRETEINLILEKYDGKSFPFQNIDDYIPYLSDINKPSLPWENRGNLVKIAKTLLKNIKDLVKEKDISLTQKEKALLNKNFEKITKKELEEYITQLRKYDLEVKEQIKKKILVNDINLIKENIEVLKDTKTLRKYLPEQFEKLIVEILKIINDEKEIKANYPVDDNGEPINHAPANKPDIECFYETFNAICEVTLNTTKLQWVQEGQPVMRHFRDFENKNARNPVFCIFVSPKIHSDTYSQFWFATKYEYDGKPQKIIPLTTEQFSVFLDTLLSLLSKGNRYTHHDLFKLYSTIAEEVKNINSYSDWCRIIEEKLSIWKRMLTHEN